jgi:uncharacterized protein (TIGR02145 family)
VHYLRAYATNSAGTGYGNELSVILVMNVPGEGVTDVDGNIYKTVKIGSQEWMAENLKTTRYSNGNAIPYVTTPEGWEALSWESGQAFKWYNNDLSNKEKYGALYTWAAAMNGTISSNENPSGKKGACPTGWHIPSNSEWAQLETYLGGAAVAGGKLKENGTTNWISPNTGATNESGFTAFPGGFCWPDGECVSMGSIGEWWSTSYGIGAGLPSRRDSYIILMKYSNIGTSRFYMPNKHGRSVRCLKD